LKKKIKRKFGILKNKFSIIKKIKIYKKIIKITYNKKNNPNRIKIINDYKKCNK
jgi:hypothetical protein